MPTNANPSKAPSIHDRGTKTTMSTSETPRGRTLAQGAGTKSMKMNHAGEDFRKSPTAKTVV